MFHQIVQGSSIRWAQGLVNFVPAVADHFCLNLPEAFSEPRARLILEPRIEGKISRMKWA